MYFTFQSHFSVVNQKAWQECTNSNILKQVKTSAIKVGSDRVELAAQCAAAAGVNSQKLIARGFLHYRHLPQENVLASPTNKIPDTIPEIEVPKSTSILLQYKL